MTEKPLVSICCITYNHGKYIRQCLESFVNQKTNFKFVVYIHDDCSTDGTTEIIKEYEQKYPDIIKPIYEEENQFSKGVSVTREYNFKRVDTKYVALCEGDDYWTDMNKLQKQVDFLEANPDHSVCFHFVQRFFENSARKDDIFPEKNHPCWKEGFNLNTLLKYNFMHTNSIMLRWNAVDNLLDKLPLNMLPEDWYINLLFVKAGKAGFINEIMSAYRVHNGGIWSDSYKNIPALYAKYYKKMYVFHKNIYDNIAVDKKEYHKTIVLFAKIAIHALWNDNQYKNCIEFCILHPILFFHTIISKLRTTGVILKTCMN